MKTLDCNQDAKAGFAASGGYAPWKPPFRYNMDGQWIEDSKGQRILDMRGWGYLTGKGSEALGMDEDDAAKIQDDIGKHVAELLTADAKAHTDKLTDAGGRERPN